MALRALLTGSGSGLSVRGISRAKGKSLAVLPFLIRVATSRSNT